MKKCNTCGTQVDEQTRFCPMCGSTDIIDTATAAQQARQFDQAQAYQQTDSPAYQPTDNPAYQAQNTQITEDDGNGNILAGIVGAFLFSIVGGFLYFVIYQIGIIAGICGLVIFVLANFGYGLFARTKNKASIVGLISAIAATIVMIFLAEYFCVSFEIYQEFKDYGITIFDAIRATPELLAEPEVIKAVAGDLAFAYIFGFLATIGNIVNIVKSRKKKQKVIVIEPETK